jgi:hypothetical protein
MYITMLKNQRVTFVSDVIQARAHSPFKEYRNPLNGCYIVHDTSKPEGQRTVAAGLSKEEAEACVMYRANQYIYNNVQKGY